MSGIRAGGTVEVHARLEGIQERLADARPVFTLIAEDFYDHVQSNFDRQSTPRGGPWPRLSALYAGGKRRGGIGVLTGKLRDSWRQGGRKNVTEIRRDRLVVGSASPRSHWAMGGTANRWVRTRNGRPLSRPAFRSRVPPRPLFDADVVEQRDYPGMIAQWIARGETETGRRFGI